MGLLKRFWWMILLGGVMLGFTFFMVFVNAEENGQKEIYDRGPSWDIYVNADGSFTKTYFFSQVNILDETGRYVPFEEYVNVSVQDGELVLSRGGDYSVSFMPVFVMNSGQQYYWQDIPDFVQKRLWTKEYRGRFKYGVDFWNISDSIKSNLKYVVLHRTNSSGLSWNDIKIEGSSVIVKDKVKLSHDDLLRTFTIPVINRTDVVIGNLSPNFVVNPDGSWNISFDPSITYNFSTAQNVRLWAYTIEDITTCPNPPDSSNGSKPSCAIGDGTWLDVTTRSELDNDDAVRLDAAITQPGGYLDSPESDMLKINASVNVSGVTLLNWTFNGNRGTPTLNASLYMWNYSGSFWYKCAADISSASQTDTTRYCAVTDTANFINSSQDNETIFIVMAGNSGTDGNIEVDFVKLEVTYTSDVSPTYSLNSTNSTTAGNAVKHILFWNDSVGLSGYFFSFWNGSNTTGNWLSADQESGIKQFIGAVSSNASSCVNVSEGFESKLFPFTNWTGGGNANWFNQSTTVYAGTDAIQGGDVSDGQATWVRASQIFCNNPKGGVNFTWKVDSEATFDYLCFCGNKTACTCHGEETDTSEERISGSVNWASYANQTSYIGNNTLEWTYRKDSATSTGSDTGWLDDVIFYNVNISSSVSGDSEANKTWQEYTGFGGENYVRLDSAYAIITVSSYNPNGSTNFEPDLEVGAYNGSEYLNLSFCNLNASMGNSILNTTSRNCTINFTSQNILSAFVNPSNRKIQIRGVFIDGGDEINVSQVYMNLSYVQEFINDSWIEMKGVGNWSNVTKTVTSTVGATVKWCVYANDSSNNWNSSSCDSPFSYLTTAAVTDSCTPPSVNNDWVVSCSDNCVKSSQIIDLGTGDLIIQGSGSFTLDAVNISYDNLVLNLSGCKFVRRTNTKEVSI